MAAETDRMTGAQALVKTLAAEGIEVIFGLPGVHAMPIYDALYEHPQIRYIGVRHEQAAAYMADGYARSTGRIGVCLTTAGPGAANTMAAMGEAYASSSPVLQVCTQINSSMLGKDKGVLHEAKDQPGMFRTVTGWSKQVESVEDIPSSVRMAMLTMRTERPRPAEIEIPADLLSSSAGVPIARPRHDHRPALDEAAITEAAAITAAVAAVVASQTPPSSGRGVGSLPPRQRQRSLNSRTCSRLRYSPRSRAKEPFPKTIPYPWGTGPRREKPGNSFRHSLTAPI